jgi:hypothetical protein
MAEVLREGIHAVLYWAEPLLLPGRLPATAVKNVEWGDAITGLEPVWRSLVGTTDQADFRVLAKAIAPDSGALTAGEVRTAFAAYARLTEAAITVFARHAA